MIYWNCVFIAIVAVLIIDLSGFIESFKSWLSRILTKGKFKNGGFRLRPFDCSFCMSWWANIVYVIIAGGLSFGMLAFILSLSFLTPVIKNGFEFIQGFAIKVINELTDYFGI